MLVEKECGGGEKGQKCPGAWGRRGTAPRQCTGVTAQRLGMQVHQRRPPLSPWVRADRLPNRLQYRNHRKSYCILILPLQWKNGVIAYLDDLGLRSRSVQLQRLPQPPPQPMSHPNETAITRPGVTSQHQTT